MDKTEQIKKLKGLIKRIEKAIKELEWVEIDVMGVGLQEYDFMQIYHSNKNVLQELKREKYIFEEELKTLQESNENTLNN